LAFFKRPPPLDDDIQEMLRSIYEELTADELLRNGASETTRKITMKAQRVRGIWFLNTFFLAEKFLKLHILLFVFLMKTSVPY